MSRTHLLPRMPLWTSLLTLTLSAACASDEGAKKPDSPSSSSSGVSEPEAPTTAYYLGTVQVSSPDGATPFGPPNRGAASRQLDPAGGKMVEKVFDEGRLRLTELTQRPGTSVFDATDDEKSFEGVLTFTGDAWAWSSWTYSIQMSDGGKLRGVAEMTPEGFTATKTFSSPDGTPRVQISERWTEVSQQEWERVVAEMTKAAKAKAAETGGENQPTP